MEAIWGRPFRTGVHSGWSRSHLQRKLARSESEAGCIGWFLVVSLTMQAQATTATIGFWEECAIRYRVLIEQDEDGVYVADVPALPGCISQGKTRSEVLDNIKEAIAGYLESLQAHGEPAPPSITEEVVEVIP